MIADVEDGRIVALRGDPDHPVTRGFLCFRTSRFLKRQYHKDRLLKPLLRRGAGQVEIPLDEALDLAAERLMRIKQESGPAAIFHYRSGGSLGMMKHLSDYFFEMFGPTTSKRGDICSGGGDAAQELDFGHEDANDIFDLYNARHIINWGKNLHVSNLHLVPVIKEARRRGTTVTTIDPVRTRSTQLSDRYLQIRPDGDLAFGLLVARILFEEGHVSEKARALCDHLDELRALAYARPVHVLLAECDLSMDDAREIAHQLADGPTAILVGWGMQRRLRGGSHVRMLDALCAISGNLGVKGGGASFYFKRRGAFDFSFMNKTPPPRTICEPMMGHEILAAKDPPIRAVWVTCGNPVAMVPDSAAVARAFDQVEFSVVVDSFPTDTTRRATLVLPTTTLLEDDDLLGAYGHHWLGVARPVVPPPPGVLTDLEIMQALAKRVGLGDEMEGTARDWKRRILAKVAPLGATLEAIEQTYVKNPLVGDVLFADQRVPTQSGRVNLIHELPAPIEEDATYPLHLLSNSTEKSQSSQWSHDLDGPITATVHPDSAMGVLDGELAKLESAVGSITVRIEHDREQRRDVVIVPKGGHFDRGQAANALIRARITDHGEGAAYLSARARIVPITGRT
jgi:anaerobic selenocysteine-containing dehydrogenase